jgi:hypothetical protein
MGVKKDSTFRRERDDFPSRQESAIASRQQVQHRSMHNLVP